MNISIRILLLLFYVTSNHISSAQFNFQFENLESKGFAHGVGALIQDSKGFLWIGTGHGLYRYDGYDFRLFLIDPAHERSLTINSITYLFEDRSQKIWVGTAHGIFLFDPVAETFKSFQNLTARSGISKFVKAINQDGDGNIWFTTETYQNESGALVLYDEEKNVFEPFNLDGLLNWPRSVLVDEYGNLWIACDRGLVVFDPRLKRTIKVVHSLCAPVPVSSRNDLSSLFFERAGVMWATDYHNGVSRLQYDSDYNLSCKTLQTSDGIVSNNAISMMKDSRGNYWITTLSGITVYNPAHNDMVNVKASDQNRYMLKDDYSKVVLEDQTGNIWIGHNGAGLSKVRYNKGFHTLSADSTSVVVLKGNKISSVYADSADHIWAAVEGQGIHEINFKGNFGKSPQIHFYPVPNRKIWSIEPHGPNLLLLAMDGGGLQTLNTRTRQIRNIAREDATIARKVSHDIIFVSGGRRLYKASPGISQFDIRELLPDSLSRKRSIWPEYSSYTKENEGQYWLSTWQGDLYHFNNQFKFTIPKVHPYELLRISEIHIDKEKFLWVAAFEGIFKYSIRRTENDIELTLEKKYTEKDGLVTREGASNAFTPAMTEDDDGNMWLGQVGLTVIDPRTHAVKRYFEEDGLPSNAMSLHCRAKTTNGYLVFGTDKGLFFFHPDSLRDNSRKPPVVLTGFRVLNNTRLLLDQTELEHFENVMTFEFSALDFTAPHKNQFAYQMVGFDRDWTYSANKRTATYTNLNPGTYSFHVKASNNDGTWNEEGTSISVIILPPPWKTWWAYTIYAFSGFALLIVAKREILKRERLRNEFKLKQMESSKYQELDKLKSRFFANISHEFRTPLTLLLSPLEKRLSTAQSERDRHEFQTMHSNASRLLHLVNQLLDLSRIEAGSLKLKTAYGNLNSFIVRIASQFSSMGESRNIHFKIISKAQIDLWFDGNKIEQIIGNLLSNAFKFTPSGGNIDVIISTENNHVKIEVSDSGIGIPPDKAGRIFERFYQVDDSNIREYEGSGIGLSLVKELTELHHGTVNVASSPGQGSCFTVRIPLGKEYLEAEGVSSENDFKLVRIMKPAEPDTISDHQAANQELPCVLIIEDNDDLRHYLVQCLKTKYAVLTASDGQEGLKIAVEEVPDLILSDLMMPKMDGLELCRQIKSNEKTSHIAVILLTAKADQRARINGLETGADDYLTKPFSLPELNARIQNMIDSRKRLRKIFSTAIILKPSDIKAVSIDDKFMKRVMEIIEAHLADTSFSVEVLADEIAMSSVQLYRKLKAITGQTPNDVIRNVRLERAVSLLEQRAGHVADVAYKVGFNSLSYFSKCFREKFGKSPSDYLKSATEKTRI